jgi:hypothetical protein
VSETTATHDDTPPTPGRFAPLLEAARTVNAALDETLAKLRALRPDPAAPPAPAPKPDDDLGDVPTEFVAWEFMAGLERLQRQLAQMPDD